MPFYDRILLHKRYIIEAINDYLKSTAEIVHLCHKFVTDFAVSFLCREYVFNFLSNPIISPNNNGREWDTHQLKIKQ